MHRLSFQLLYVIAILSSLRVLASSTLCRFYAPLDIGGIAVALCRFQGTSGLIFKDSTLLGKPVLVKYHGRFVIDVLMYWSPFQVGAYYYREFEIIMNCRLS
jgi:hypothetical protein